jgi:hypothetical protein
MLYHLRDPVAAIWKPAATTFDAEEASDIVASVFGAAEAERWDAPLITLPDHDAVRDYLIARFVPSDDAAASAAKVSTPATITKRGASIRATRRALLEVSRPRDAGASRR